MGTVLELDVTTGLYDQDFYVWTMEQADLLRRHKPDWMDWENVAEELEFMGKKDRRELVSRMTILLIHLTKWYWQPEKRSPGWLGTIEEQWEQIDLILNDSPSLRSFIQCSFQGAWGRVVKKAAKEPSLPLSTFSETCPWPIEDILGEWMPE